MAGASPHRSRRKMQRTTLAGATLIQHVTKCGFDPTYELLARQRQTVMLRHVKPTRPGQHQQHQRTQASISSIRGGLFFPLTQKDRNLAQNRPLWQRGFIQLQLGDSRKTRQS